MLRADIARINKISRRIDGWFSKEAAMLFGWIDEIQQTAGISGNVFEVGCHHGKSAVLLGEMVQPGTETLAVCDLFGMQADNVSRSGSGDRAVFDRNMKNALSRGVKLQVFQKNSVQLSHAEIGGDYRFFHVDGGHNPDEALADLNLAARCLHPSGVIALDDPFRMDWPGVTEALLRFLDAHGDFEAIVVGCNKILLARKKAAQMYMKELDSYKAREGFGFGYPWKVKELPFHNSALRILYVPDYRQKKTFGNLLRRFFYATPLHRLRKNQQGVRQANPTGNDKMVPEKVPG